MYFKDLRINVPKFINNNEKILTVLFSFIQTVVIILGVAFALNEIKAKEIGSTQAMRAVSWDMYKSYQLEIKAIRQLFEYHWEALDEKEELDAIHTWYSPKEVKISEMYTEFEMCISTKRCNEEVLITLACLDSVDLAKIVYQNNGEFLFMHFSMDEKAKKYDHRLNLFRFTKRCQVAKPGSHNYPWLKSFEQIVSEKIF